MPLHSTPRTTARRPRAAKLPLLAVAMVLMVSPHMVTAQKAVPTTPAPPTRDDWVYVGAESADNIYRVRFGPAGAVVEKTIRIDELAAEMEGPHGLAMCADGTYLHMTTGHGFSDGKYWRYELGPDTLVRPGVLLGNFPASIDVTPDGLSALAWMTSSSRSTRAPSRSRAASRWPKGIEGPLPATAGAMAGMNHTMYAGHDMGAAAPKKAAAPVVDLAQVGRAGMGMDKHDMAPASYSPTWAQPSARGDQIFVACNKADEILEIDTKVWTVSRRLKTALGMYNLAVTADGSLLVATLKQGNAVEIFLCARDNVGAADVGHQASGIAFWRMGK